MILLSLQGIQKSFGTNEVLRDVSFTLQDGQRMGLVGVNGCGKSTLMKIIAGLESYDGGTMTVDEIAKLMDVGRTTIYRALEKTKPQEKKETEA